MRTTSIRWICAGALCLGMLWAPNIRAQDPAAAATQDDPETGQPSLLHHFSMQMQFTNVYDTNIDHDDRHVASYGWVPGLRVRFRSSPVKPVFSVIYVVARHDYTNTEKWDRISNKVAAVLEPSLHGRLRMQTSGEVSLGGSSEDRDVSNQYLLVQEFEYRFTRDYRLQLYGTYRLKHFPDSPDDNAIKPNVGLRFEQRLSGGRRWEVGARFEVNRERRNPRGEYDRWTFDMDYRIPVFHRKAALTLGAKYRRKYYQEKTVRIEKMDRLRRDFRWVLEAQWQHTLPGGAVVELAYAFETRDSNDPDKLYSAHLLSLGFAYDLW